MSTPGARGISPEIQEIIDGIDALDDVDLQLIYQEEANVTVKDASGKEIQRKMISMEDLEDIKKDFKKQLKKEQNKQALLETGMLRIAKKNSFLPRTFTIMQFPNGKYHVFIETKSKLESAEIDENEKIDRRLNPKPSGTSKHGTPCIVLWPRVKGKANKQWWNSVFYIPSTAKSLGGIDVNDIKKEAAVSQQNHPFIHPSYIGEEFTGGKGRKISFYSEIGEGDFRKKYNETDNLRIITSFIMGIKHLHDQGILYRDVKPDNILVMNENGKLYGRVCDFGTSVEHKEKSVGTPFYMSPQVLAKSAFSNEDAILAKYLFPKEMKSLTGATFKAQPADDIWGIGAVLFVKFKQSDQDRDYLKQLIEIQAKIKQNQASGDEIEQFNQANPIWQIMANCLQFDPNNRYTMDQLLQAFNQHYPELVTEFTQMIVQHRQENQDVPVAAGPPPRPEGPPPLPEGLPPLPEGPPLWPEGPPPLPEGPPLLPEGGPPPPRPEGGPPPPPRPVGGLPLAFEKPQQSTFLPGYRQLTSMSKELQDHAPGAEQAAKRELATPQPTNVEKPAPTAQYKGKQLQIPAFKNHKRESKPLLNPPNEQAPKEQAPNKETFKH